MVLISLDKISLAYGDRPLLDHVCLELDEGQRACVVGRNGEGKSTLLKVVQGQVKPDDGKVWRKPELRIASLEQALPEGERRTVFELIASALREDLDLLSEYENIAHELEAQHDENKLKRLGQLQHSLDVRDAWHWQRRVERVISELDIPRDTPLDQLSGGYKRRVLLAKALVINPQLLLLDEPTNHLDIEGIQWLEEFLLAYRGAILFVTHDRSFLQRLATEILELDRGRLEIYPGDYQTYLRRKKENEAAEARQNALFDKKLAEEERWIRQGIKARRTRNEGRVRALQELRKQRAARREKQKVAKFSLEQGESSGKLVAQLENISHQYGDAKLVDNFSTQIMRGDRIGLIGPNGIGKTTLLKIILGQLAPQSGKVKLGTRLQVAYFDQHRAQLDSEKSVADNLNHGSDHITINGQSRHVMSYLQDFLFTPQRVRSPVKSLSGGERNRLLLARLFLKPANILVLDEPTNDLDVETLELLEEKLMDYDGTLLLVSHDRAFLDNVVTSTLVFKGQGQIEENVGGYSDWKRLEQSRGATQEAAESKRAGKQSKPASTNDTQAAAGKNKKLSYKDQRELHNLPARIESLEQEKADVEQSLNDPSFYKQEQSQIQPVLAQLEELNQALEEAYARWEELES